VDPSDDAIGQPDIRKADCAVNPFVMGVCIALFARWDYLLGEDGMMSELPS
jgi:hypothetical protein